MNEDVKYFKSATSERTDFLSFMETNSILQMDAWNTRFLVGFWMDFAYFQGWTVSFTGKKYAFVFIGEVWIHPLKLPGCWDGQSMTRNEHGHQVGSLLGLSRFGGDLLQMISLREKAVTFWMLSWNLRCWVSMISGVVMGLNDLCGTDAFMQLVFCLFTPCHCTSTRESARVFFYSINDYLLE